MSVFIGAIDDGRRTKISKLKKGEYFRKANQKRVYIYEGKQRIYSRFGEYRGWGFVYSAWDDISYYGQTKKDIDVDVDFTF